MKKPLMQNRLLSLVLLFLVLFAACGKKSNPTGSENTPAGLEDKPPACDITGTWHIAITVTGGTQLPAGTRFMAELDL